MKKRIIIANWKMQLSFKEAKFLAKEILIKIKKKEKEKKKLKDFDIVLCPPFMSIAEVAKIFTTKENSKRNILSCGAQDCFWEEKGGFTGEISPLVLKELGCKYVILGHSERRQFLGETNEMIHKKVRTVVNLGLIPIICVGETREERDRGLKEHTILTQVSKALEGINLKIYQKIIIAYEPVWVIGSGQAIDSQEAEYMAKIILQRTIDIYPLPIVHNNIRIVYGGSINSTTVRSFINQETIDGVLVGSASLKAEEFIKMCELMPL
ncbi:MAG: triose-phosphate isomerase [Patescibacteria group bacterium]|jgi:triosephosphate isomerase|nr:triose-phosphate isomerase [Patescibacteria group bacterium]MDD5172542.1 triose-phosphate isomerase [Patescibacteria group bacterium]